MSREVRIELTELELYCIMQALTFLSWDESFKDSDFSEKIIDNMVDSMGGPWEHVRFMKKIEEEHGKLRLKHFENKT